ncbi:hypothetical protein N665_0039s0134 [Sinapis alba]|nr:hypothetical protein N665_0039s0134 [Sinapis alba]
MRAKRKKGRPPSVLTFRVAGLIRSSRHATVAKQQNLSLPLADLSGYGGAASGTSLPATSSAQSDGPLSYSGAGSGPGLDRTPSVSEITCPSVAELPGLVEVHVGPLLPDLAGHAGPLLQAEVSSPNAGIPSINGCASGSGLTGALSVKDPIPPATEPLPDSCFSAPVNSVQNYASLLKSSGQLQVLGSPSEHVSGAPFVLIPDENIEAAKLEFKDYVYARFHGDYPSMGKIIGVVNAVWAKTGPRIFVHNIGQGIYLLRVTNPRAREVLLSRTCWNIGGLPMFVAPWSPDYSPEEPPLTSAIVHVELRNVPYLLFNRESLSRIATAVGKPESLFPETERKEIFAVAKLYVKEVQIDVSYPWLPVKCGACKKFGHNKEKCNARILRDPPVSSGNKESIVIGRRRSKSRPGRSMDRRAKKVEARYVPVLREGDVENSDLEEGEFSGDGVVDIDRAVTLVPLVSEMGHVVANTPRALSPTNIPHIALGPATSEGSHQPLATQANSSPQTVEVNQCQKTGDTIDVENYQIDSDNTNIVPETDQGDITQPSGELEKPFFLVKNRKSGRKVTNRQ